MFNRNWNNPRMGMRGPGPGMWRPPPQHMMHRAPAPRVRQPLIRPGGGFNPQAVLQAAADEVSLKAFIILCLVNVLKRRHYKN